MAKKASSRGGRARTTRPIQEFTARFRGVRGSYSAPYPECLGYGGHTICLEVRVGGHLVIFDAGTGIISLGKDLMAARNGRRTHAPLVASVFLSHAHHDHVHGLAYFDPAHSRHCEVNIFGLRPLAGSLGEMLSHAVHHSYFPADLTEMSGIQSVRTLDDRDVVIFEKPGTHPTVRLRHGFDPNSCPHKVVMYAQKNTAHPKGGTLFYRIEYLGRSLVFATDTEGYVGGDTRLCRFAEGATLLVHDTQYTSDEYIQQRQGWGHSTVEMAAAVAKKARINRLAMYHYDPSYSDSVVEGLERLAQGVFPNTFAPREGDEVDLLTL